MKTMLLLAVSAVLAVAVQAAEPELPLRDPMQPPAAARPVLPASADAPAPAAVVRQILVVDGKPHVVEGTRLRGVGDKLGEARIERFEDSAVWVRENGQLRRLSLFGTVTRRSVAVEPNPPAAVATSASAPRPRRPALAQATSSASR